MIISDIPSPNDFETPFGFSNNFRMCDFSSNKTYSFDIKDYRLSPFKPKRPIHFSGTKVVAFINNVDIENKQVILLFFELETEEKLKLVEVSY